MAADAADRGARDVGSFASSSPPASADDLITGGGAVRNSEKHSVDLIDTSGWNPVVAECRQVRAALRTLSADFATRTPTRTYPTLVIRPGETTVTLDATGGEVLEVEGLRMAGARRSLVYDFPAANCAAAENATLEILSDPGARPVINLRGRLWLGLCHEIQSTDVIFNAVGKGSVTVTELSGAGYYTILAPDRKVQIDGGKGYSDFHSQRYGTVVARKLRIVGSAQVGLGEDTLCD